MFVNMWKSPIPNPFGEHIVEDIVEEIKVLSWRWTLNRIYILACVYHEWCWNPKDCLVRVARRSFEVAIGRWW